MTPVVVLTKADACADPDAYVDRARALGAAVPVEAVNAPRSGVGRAARGSGAAAARRWRSPGSSGVGKSTLTNALTGAALATRGIREDDARGRHTTTARSLHRTRAGGWLIDTPGMRALRLADVAEGIEAVFDDMAALARGLPVRRLRATRRAGLRGAGGGHCRRARSGRLARWRKLAREDARNSATLAEARARERAWGRFHRSVKRDIRRRKG